MSTQNRDNAVEEGWEKDGLFVLDQYCPSFTVMCKREKFLEFREAILAALPPGVLRDDFDRENIQDITITDLSRDPGSKAHPGFLIFLLVVFGAIAIATTVCAIMT